MSAPVITTILVTTDLSTEASKAYPYARLLAEKLGAKLRIATFLDTSVQMGLGGPFDMPVVYLPEAVSEIKEKTNKDLQALIQEHFAGMNVRAEVRESPSAVHYAIADFIAEQGIDMVVMASHGRSGLTRTILGSVAEQVLRRSTKPVVIVPARE